MMCWGRKLKRDQATQTDISYVHWMRLVEYDRENNVGSRVVQRNTKSRLEPSSATMQSIRQEECAKHSAECAKL